MWQDAMESRQFWTALLVLIGMICVISIYVVRQRKDRKARAALEAARQKAAGAAQAEKREREIALVFPALNPYLDPVEKAFNDTEGVRSLLFNANYAMSAAAPPGWKSRSPSQYEIERADQLSRLFLQSMEQQKRYKVEPLIYYDPSDEARTRQILLFLVTKISS